MPLLVFFILLDMLPPDEDIFVGEYDLADDRLLDETDFWNGSLFELVFGPRDEEDVEGFLLAGPELTPGFRPVCVFGELDPELNEALLVRLEPPDSFSFDFVLLIVIFMPSELCLTMYSELLLAPKEIRKTREKQKTMTIIHKSDISSDIEKLFVQLVPK